MDSRSFETRHLIFDAAWKADASPPLGKLERAFDYPQFLRLKTDAMREAAGADVGVIWEHTPPWNRWGDSLPAGPVTLHDLATIDMLPENIGVAEMTGAELLHSRPSATTLVADRRDPAHDGKAHLSAADIDPARTYRVAMGYFGMPSYGAEPDRMPKLFPFATPEDFLAVRTDHIALKDFRQLPTQVIEATAQYIRKHERVSPRPVCFDLTEYIMDPEDNEYGACDWLHLGVEAPWKDAGKGADAGRTDRYTLNLGLRAAGEPEAAPPRGNSKRFIDLDVTAKGTSFTFAGLDKKLPVAVTMTARRHTIAARETEGYRLADAEANDGVVGRCLLVNLRLADAGPTDVAGTAIISASELRQVWRQTWPDEEDKGSRGFYAGYHRARGEERKPPEHEDAALLLFAGEMPKTATLIAPNAGYNFGLAGVSASVALKAGSTLSLRLLLIAFDRPPGSDAGLAQVLDALREDLTRNDE